MAQSADQFVQQLQHEFDTVNISLQASTEVHTQSEVWFESEDWRRSGRALAPTLAVPFNVQGAAKAAITAAVSSTAKKHKKRDDDDYEYEMDDEEADRPFERYYERREKVDDDFDPKAAVAWLKSLRKEHIVSVN